MIQNKNLLLTLSITATFILSGCAALTISSQHPKLVNAKKSTNNALKQAKKAGGDTYFTETYSSYQSTYSQLVAKQNNNPDFSLINRYRDLEIKLYDLTVRSLRKKMEKKNRTIKEGGAMLDKVKQKLADLKENNKELTRYKRQYRQIISELKQNRMSLKKQLKKKTKKVNELKKENIKYAQRIDALKQKNKNIRSKLRNDIKQVKIKERRKRLYITLENKLLFKLGESNINNNRHKTLTKIADVLRQYPNRELRVAGYTDDIPVVTDKYKDNWGVSADRALSIVRYFVEKENISADRFGALAFGEHRPVVKNNSQKNRAKNRRVEIIILPTEIIKKDGTIKEGKITVDGHQLKK